MKIRSLKALTIVGSSGIMIISGAALAEQSENDALQIERAKISLTEAVAAAEAKTGGRATKAEYENAAEGWIFDVEVVAGKTVSDVHVNAETGAILSVAADAVDNDEEEQDPAD